MTTLDRRTVLAGLAAGVVAGCTDAGTDVAGTRKKPPKGGIGGTGIVGTLTDFGSVKVNGLTVAVGSGTEILGAAGTRQVKDLQVGQMLSIEASGGPDALTAARLVVVHPVVGTVSAISTARGLATIGGVTVRVEPGAIGQLVSGTRVAVSGAWNGAQVIASRFDRVSDAIPDSRAGTVRGLGDGRWTIGGAPVSVPSGIAPEDEGFATLTGQAEAGGFTTTSWTAGRFTGAAGPLEALSVEGYLAPTAKAPFHAVDGLGHSFAPDSRLAAFIGKRTLFTGSYDGTFVVETGKTLPEDLEARRKLLRG